MYEIRETPIVGPHSIRSPSENIWISLPLVVTVLPANQCEVVPDCLTRFVRKFITEVRQWQSNYEKFTILYAVFLSFERITTDPPLEGMLTLQLGLVGQRVERTSVASICAWL